MKSTKRIQSLFASLAGLALITSTGGAANAGPRDALAETPASVTTAAVSSERAAEVTSEAMASLASGEIDIQASLESLKASDSKVSTVSTPTGQYTTVTVPLGEPYSLTSNVSMVLDSTGHRLQ